jgi:hypothetical protein
VRKYDNICAGIDRTDAHSMSRLRDRRSRFLQSFLVLTIAAALGAGSPAGAQPQPWDDLVEEWERLAPPAEMAPPPYPPYSPYQPYQPPPRFEPYQPPAPSYPPPRPYEPAPLPAPYEPAPRYEPAPLPQQPPVRDELTSPRQEPALPREELARPTFSGGAVAQHVGARVPSDLANHFNTILYVSKARRGAWAQQMFVLKKDASGEFSLTDSFPVSTGRERREKYFTTTPAGIFTLHPQRMFRMHRSKTWDDAPMPYAMFFDVTYTNRATGIALHAATGSGIKQLGRRASGGCVRMPPAKVKALFEEIQAGQHDGMIPEFAWDSAAGRTSTNGTIKRTIHGDAVMKRGISVLVVIEDYPGHDALTASAGRGRT